MTPDERASLRRSLIPYCTSSMVDAVEWLITLLARVENLEKRLA